MVYVEVGVNGMIKKIILLSIILLNMYAQAQTGSFALYDYTNQQFKSAYNIHEVRPIASITKLFTAITILRSGVELDEKVKVNGSSKGHFPNGILVSRRDLMRAMLVSSDNRAAETLARTYPNGFSKFIYDVNEYVQSHGLIHTHLDDSTGLSFNNVSSAEDLLKFLETISENEIIRDMADMRTADINITKGRKIIKIHLYNTNPSIFKFDNILISKTGFTNPAGRCVIMLVEKDKKNYGIIILGQKTIKARSQIATELITSTD